MMMSQTTEADPDMVEDPTIPEEERPKNPIPEALSRLEDVEMMMAAQAKEMRKMFLMWGVRLAEELEEKLPKMGAAERKRTLEAVELVLVDRTGAMMDRVRKGLGRPDSVVMDVVGRVVEKSRAMRRDPIAVLRATLEELG